MVVVVTMGQGVLAHGEEEEPTSQQEATIKNRGTHAVAEVLEQAETRLRRALPDGSYSAPEEPEPEKHCMGGQPISLSP